MLTDKGFQRRTYDDLLKGQERRAREVFGEDIDTAELTPLGKFIRIAVYDFAVAYEQLERAYLARFPNSATGVSLDRLCPFAGIRRNPRTNAIHLVEFTGDPGYTVPDGFLVATKAGAVFYTLASVSLDGAGLGCVGAACIDFGEAGNVPKGSITEIVNPQAQLKGVAHTEVLSLGTDVESDSSLRIRWNQAIAGAGSANAAAIAAEILRVPGIESVTVIENDQDYTDYMGRPPHTFESYALGDATKDNEIAQAIFRKKPIGIKAFGSISVSVADEGGFPHDICFTRTIQIWLRMRVEIRTDNIFEGDAGVREIADKLAAHVMVLGNGGDVVHSSLYGKIHSVAGVVEVVRVLMSADDGANYTPDNIVCEPWQVARLLAENVEVLVIVDE